MASNSTRARILTAIAATLLAGAANASLIGDTVVIDRMFNGSSAGGGPFNVFVQAGNADATDVTARSGNIVVDVEAEHILIHFSSGASFPSIPGAVHEVIISDLDWLTDPTGIVIDIDATVNGNAAFSSTRASFGPDSVVLDVSSYSANGSPWNVRINLITSHQSVPEPATAALLGLALGAVGLRRQRARRGRWPLDPSSANNRGQTTVCSN